ncbi:MAG: MBL fold metallo-hydrolase [Lautropia sp.]
MRFASLGSGSEGNALVVERHAAPTTGRARYILVDCGFRAREAVRRIERLGLDLADLEAVLVTHEHGDHAGGAFQLAKLAEVPVWLTHGTMLGAVRCAGFDERRCRLLEPDRHLAIGAFGVLPFAVPHDAREPVQFVIDDGSARLGLLTDVGRSTPHVVQTLSGVDALVLECNHDRGMLEAGRYPPMLKRRIGGDYGHLENLDAASILSSIGRTRLKTVVAAHLSRENNRPALAQLALSSVLGCAPAEVTVADQDEGCGWQSMRPM